MDGKTHSVHCGNKFVCIERPVRPAASVQRFCIRHGVQLPPVVVEPCAGKVKDAQAADPGLVSNASGRTPSM